jgi:azurin
MKTVKNIVKNSFALLMIFTFFVSTSAFAQDAKVIEMEGLNTLKFSKTEITAKPGQKITVKLTTVSKMPPQAMAHNFVLLKQSADATAVAQASAKYADNEYISPEMKDKIIAYTGMAGGGETVEVTFTAPEKPGEYTYVCTFPGHFLGGMKGTLTVE